MSLKFHKIRAKVIKTKHYELRLILHAVLFLTLLFLYFSKLDVQIVCSSFFFSSFYFFLHFLLHAFCVTLRDIFIWKVNIFEYSVKWTEAMRTFKHNNYVYQQYTFFFDRYLVVFLCLYLTLVHKRSLLVSL